MNTGFVLAPINLPTPSCPPMSDCLPPAYDSIEFHETVKTQQIAASVITQPSSLGSSKIATNTVRNLQPLIDSLSEQISVNNQGIKEFNNESIMRILCPALVILIGAAVIGGLIALAVIFSSSSSTLCLLICITVILALVELCLIETIFKNFRGPHSWEINENNKKLENNAKLEPFLEKIKNNEEFKKFVNNLLDRTELQDTYVLKYIDEQNLPDMCQKLCAFYSKISEIPTEETGIAFKRLQEEMTNEHNLLIQDLNKIFTKANFIKIETEKKLKQEEEKQRELSAAIALEQQQAQQEREKLLQLKQSLVA